MALAERLIPPPSVAERRAALAAAGAGLCFRLLACCAVLLQWHRAAHSHLRPSTRRIIVCLPHTTPHTTPWPGRYLLSRGVTAVGDMGWGLFGSPAITWDDLELVYDAAARDGSMPVR
jgi:hypothetical protein